MNEFILSRYFTIKIELAREIEYGLFSVSLAYSLTKNGLYY